MTDRVFFGRIRTGGAKMIVNVRNGAWLKRFGIRSDTLSKEELLEKWHDAVIDIATFKETFRGNHVEFIEAVRGILKKHDLQEYKPS